MTFNHQRHKGKTAAGVDAHFNAVVLFYDYQGYKKLSAEAGMFLDCIFDNERVAIRGAMSSS